MDNMDRRHFLKNLSLGTLAVTSGVPFLSAASNSKRRSYSPSNSIPIPTQPQIKWQEAERVAVFHYDLHVFDGKQYVQSRNRITPIEDYNIFNPEQLDTDQWIKSIKDAGFKIAILTATHETGFALYQSDVNPYCLKAVKWRDGKGDLVRDFVDSCRKYDIEPGIYVGIRWNSFYGVHDFLVNGDGEFAENRQEHYNRMCEGIVEELTSRYGELAIIWFDGGAYGPERGGPDVLSIFERNQPNGIFYHNDQRADIRWGGSETGTVPYPCWGTFPYPYSHTNKTGPDHFELLKYGDPDGDYYMPAMSDAPLRGHSGGHDWFWEPDREHTIYPLENLVDMHYKSVGRNSTLIVGLTPDPSGLLPEADAERLKEWGEEIERRFEAPVAQSEGRGSEYVINFDSEKELNHVVLQEDIKHGERVRTYTVEGYKDREWQEICSGQCIGHKRIQEFETDQYTGVKLIIDESLAEPRIRNFSVFHVT
ncbi:alpha-L-fucosidase [Rhodohalobacter sulfatireducens]|uniref:alpha-L-fucosidase n=1 Tax=Rhodohalobacter sulfatireducens TaxID=2911366 RepID=A0ABS9KHX4_9BACT|nr:alpha-L-fucosidase [Rhodohalobacter sulfatireducens]MCG2590440.1 alpha-L-fucosidase [Rhodohalobacter sulfatireducens]